MISAIKANTGLPLIVGGGIKSLIQIETAFSAGADLVVIGNKVEEDENFLLDIKTLITNKNFFSTN